jgi:hypothetical protein
VRYLPVNFTWRVVDVVDADGVAERRFAMVPAKRYANVCGRQFHEDEEYPLAPLEARSRSSHNHFFAALADGFANIPEDVGMVQQRLNIKTMPPGGWKDEEHFRAWALCETGWCDLDEFEFDSPKDAVTFARYCRKKDDERDAYTMILVRGKHVTIKTPKSQSAANMSKEPFEQSKRDVLDLLETITGLKKGTLNKEAGKHA